MTQRVPPGTGARRRQKNRTRDSRCRMFASFLSRSFSWMRAGMRSRDLGIDKRAGILHNDLGADGLPGIFSFSACLFCEL